MALRWFGIMGLAAYVVLAITCSNIQVLTGTQFSLFQEPFALGTVTFASTYLAIDIVTEYYGPSLARQIVKLGLLSMVIVSGLMLVSLGHACPNPQDSALHQMFTRHHQCATSLFTPSPAIFLSSMLAYWASETADIWIYSRISSLTSGRWLWVRTQVSGVISAFIDTCVFSALAWVIFAPIPVSVHTLISTYILSGFLIRVPIAILGTPCIYLAKWVRPKTHNNALNG